MHDRPGPALLRPRWVLMALGSEVAGMVCVRRCGVCVRMGGDAEDMQPNFGGQSKLMIMVVHVRVTKLMSSWLANEPMHTTKLFHHTYQSQVYNSILHFRRQPRVLHSGRVLFPLQ